jgi:hypothetical protein
MDPRDIGILFYLTASSATVADGLELLARYVGTTNEAVLVEISRHKKLAENYWESAHRVTIYMNISVLRQKLCKL